jgi:hypothetical protein
LEDIERKTGWKINRIGASLPEIIKKYGGFLPSGQARYCTRKAKIEPMQKWLADARATIYYGLRADEYRTGYVPVSNSKITPKYPLQEMGVDIYGVWAILEAQELLPPSFCWERLYETVSKQSDISVLTPIEKHFLFAGRSRANCYFCFYQRMSELLYLLETHPYHYAQMESFERSEYTWKDGIRLSDFREDKYRQAQIFQQKVRDILRYIGSKQQLSIPGLKTDNELSLTSCGLLCGK